ncbi:hypothetical protein KI659_03270 [Litoribacter alkaliphilus]|uniref:Uncharacterized protein n=1 Tax=Litoribacter ruber TaxID=702568 RepID=A0AAP2CG91_9BACT|nr:hypothetical protein [Litoribacter alkaliphilus]MBS9523029.1 hypothetical protein [Litoribacter alkaliphilus]
MKTLFTFALAFGITLMSVADPKNQLTELSGVAFAYDKAKVTLLEGAGRVKVSLYDKEGNRLHTRSVSVKESVTIPYDLSDLPTGAYLIRIENKLEKVDHIIETKNRAPKTQGFKAIVKKGKSDNSMKLSVYEVNQAGLDVKLIDDENKVVYREFIENDEPFVRKYNLKSISKDRVYVVVTDKNGHKQYFHN